MLRITIYKIAIILANPQFREDDINTIFDDVFQKDRSKSFMKVLEDYKNKRGDLAGSFIFLTAYLEDSHFQSLNEAFTRYFTDNNMVFPVSACQIK